MSILDGLRPPHMRRPIISDDLIDHYARLLEERTGITGAVALLHVEALVRHMEHGNLQRLIDKLLVFYEMGRRAE